MKRGGANGAQGGLTLVELLVGMALMGVVLTALVSYFSQGSRVATQSSGRAELQQEVLTAQQLIAGRLKEAWYVFPEGQEFSMGNGDFRKNPLNATGTAVIDNGSGTWKVGTHPFLALILPPKLTGSSTCPASSSSSGNVDYCYRFFAYYPVNRSVWVGNAGGASSPSASNPGDDPANANVWVLAEYRKTLYGYAPGNAFAPDGGDANLLADFVAPTLTSTGFTTSANTYPMFEYKSANGSTTSASNPVTGVTLNLATTRNVGGKVLRLPGATGTYSITIYPTNLGKVAAN